MGIRKQGLTALSGGRRRPNLDAPFIAMIPWGVCAAKRFVMIVAVPPGEGAAHM